VTRNGNLACGRQAVYGCIRYSDVRCTSTVAAVTGDVGSGSTKFTTVYMLVIGSGKGWWWPRLAETTAGDGMLMLQAAIDCMSLHLSYA